MARHTYNCGGRGRHGKVRGPCSYCGRIHPRGSHQKAKARAKGWPGCINKKLQA